MENKSYHPIVKKLNYNRNSLDQLENELHKNSSSLDEKLLFRYPTIYIIDGNNQESKKKTPSYSVYVGETNDIRRRTLEHLNDGNSDGSFWQGIKNDPSSEILIVGHRHFNKSLTLDIENRLMHYISGISSVTNLTNRRTNQQDEYYTSDELEDIFKDIWQELETKKPELFPSINAIEDTAIFKSSPFQKLTYEQFNAKDTIIAKIEEAINRNKQGQLILVTGEAGTGKTVLLSNLFYELFKSSAKDSDNVILKGTTETLLVNHDEQVKVYKQIAEKLGMINKKNPDIVSKPTHFINSNHQPVDILLVDEAHLLWTQGKQSYRGKNQLNDLLKMAKVVVAVFDEKQILSTVGYMSNDEIGELKLNAKDNNSLVQLENQMRIHSSKKTVEWIRNLIDEQKITKIPRDDSFDLKIFDSPEKMYQEIRLKSQDTSHGISRMLATFDWPYIQNKKNKDGNPWEVSIDKFSLPWNLQLPIPKKQKQLPWAEQDQTIGEVGSTFTIQGFDLNYAGVIIGPSVKFRHGKIIFDKTASKNKHATQKRNGKIDNSTEFLRNELNVLLTRGVYGLYIYAVDKALQQKLLEAQKG